MIKDEGSSSNYLGRTRDKNKEGGGGREEKVG